MGKVIDTTKNEASKKDKPRGDFAPAISPKPEQTESIRSHGDFDTATTRTWGANVKEKSSTPKRSSRQISETEEQDEVGVECLLIGGVAPGDVDTATNEIKRYSWDSELIRVAHTAEGLLADFGDLSSESMTKLRDRLLEKHGWRVRRAVGYASTEWIVVHRNIPEDLE